MAYELKQNYLSGGGFFSDWSPEFDIAESDDEGYDKFHRQFMKEYFPDKLTLRTFFENDIALMEKWLDEEYIKKFYHEPQDWLNEINNRNGKFNFIKHFIAERNGEPVGFCQYYDCFNALEYEDWGFEIPEQGTFSIDYLIGNPDYLNKGYGKEIVRLLTETIRSIPYAKEIIVQPESDNRASQGVLTANGYVFDERYGIYRIFFNT